MGRRTGQETTIMYDASFDTRDATPSAIDRRLLWLLRIGALVATLVAATANARVPGVPVLQNAWATSGFVAALNLGGGSGASVYGGAIGWTPGSGRFQVSAG